MINHRPQDAIHKSYLNRLLIEICDRPTLAHNLAFKGGTCAAMLGYLDRFSVDLDFDVVTSITDKLLRQELHQVFDHLGMKVAKEFDQVLFFQVRYPGNPGQRSTIKISANTLKVIANQYKVQNFVEIDRLLNSQTIETMFANKLVAITDRYARHKSIAGRDIYDIHHFFIQGYTYHAPVIAERTGITVKAYLQKLSEFIKTNVTQTLINEDLNTLLSQNKFHSIRKVLLPETLAFLQHELAQD